MKLRILAATILGLFAFTLTVLAQVSINGSLRGRVSDPGDAALAGAGGDREYQRQAVFSGAGRVEPCSAGAGHAVATVGYSF